MKEVALEKTPFDDYSDQKVADDENKVGKIKKENNSNANSLCKEKLREKEHKRGEGKAEDFQKSENKIIKRKSKKDKTCLICSKVFQSVKILNIHKRKHEKITPFKCDICHTYYKQIKTLKKHMKIHTSYKCDECIRYFADENKLTQHVEQRHNNTKRKNRIIVHDENDTKEPTEAQQSTSESIDNRHHTTLRGKRPRREVTEDKQQSKPAKIIRSRVSENVKAENLLENFEENLKTDKEVCEVN